jgi:hypothetical protein
MTRLTARSSTIFIATTDETRVYRSVSEIPAPLRRKLQESTHSMNSATILIADALGREELLRAVKERQSQMMPSIAETIRSPQKTCPATSQAPRRAFFPWRRWLEVLVPAALGASLWFFIDTQVYRFCGSVPPEPGTKRRASPRKLRDTNAPGNVSVLGDGTLLASSSDIGVSRNSS